MKIFIADRMEADRKILKHIIQSKDLGFVIGESEDISTIKNIIVDIEPDLILFDFTNNKEEKYTFLQDIKKGYKTKLIRISDDYNKSTVEKSYKVGVDYFIYKPINEYEVKTIINKIKREIEETEKLKEIKKIINDLTSHSMQQEKEEIWQKKLNYILLKLGIIGEKGSEDIRKIICFMTKNKVNINDISIREICTNFTDKPRNMEQKIRRAINMAMINIANLGIEDYMNEIFIEYSNTLFNFEQVKKEMDYIRGKSNDKGSINMKKFLSGIHVVCENYND